MSKVEVREGQAPGKLTREVFSARFRLRFSDPAFEQESAALARIEQIAWDAYCEGRKAPKKRKAGNEFEDPSYELAEDWIETRARLKRAQVIHDDPNTRGRVLVICGSPRNDGTCPSEMSKSFRLAQAASDVLKEEEQMDVDLLDLSLVTSEYGRTIHPCKGCVSTAMPMCHWPCSCYPNYSLGQVDDWMNEIYERWTLAHGVFIITPVHWYQATSPLKLMIDRLVCADGGNPDPTRTQGKDPKKAKKIELEGWDYPQHLSKRAYGVVVHGDVAGIENVRRALCDWLEWMGLVEADSRAKLDRMIGYYEPYATSHQALDRDEAFQQEVRNGARAVADCVRGLRSGAIKVPMRSMTRPRPK